MGSPALLHSSAPGPVSPKPVRFRASTTSAHRPKAIAGDAASARQLLDEVLAGEQIPAYEVAKVHLALGDKGEALRWLRRAFEERAHSMVFLQMDRQLKPLHGEPQFEALVKQVEI